MFGSSGTAHAAPITRKRDRRREIAQWRLAIHEALRPVGLSVCIFLFTFARWIGIPSPFAAAFLAAMPDKPGPLMLLGLGASVGLRLLWRIELDVWQYVGCVGLWLLLQKCRPKSTLEAAALSGLAMVPRIAAAMVGGQTLWLVYSIAALPMGMLFAMLFRTGMDAAQRSGAACRASERLCLFGMWLLAVSGLGFFRIGALNLGQALGVTTALVISFLTGPVYGVLSGLSCGVALALGGHESGLALSLCLCGLAGMQRKRWLALPAVLAFNAFVSYLILDGRLALSWWAAAVGSLGFLCLSPLRLEKLKPWFRGNGAGEKTMENAFVAQRIAHMQEAIQNLAKALPNTAETLLTPQEELKELLCAQCANRELCWGRSRAKTEKMLSHMLSGEVIDPANCECLRADAAPEVVKDALLARQRKRASLQKARYERELTLTHLAALSGTLGDLGQLAAGESYNDLRAAHVITLAMEERDIPARLSYARRVDGHLQAALEARNLSKKALDGLLASLAREEGIPLSVSRSEHGVIELEEIPLYSASVGMASLCANGTPEGVCGDACSAKRCEGGRLLMMLCDGMGHGEKAHVQSEKTVELLLLLLEAGYTRHQAMKAVNGIMLGTQEERFSTVDLADVDLWTGEVSSEKLGACASWVVRGNHLKKIEGSSLPLGIMQEASPTAAQYRLHSGDILILMSDGVADAFSDDAAFRRTLLESVYIHPQRMADALLRNALLALGGTPKDDMSVMVLLLMDRQRVGGQ